MAWGTPKITIRQFNPFNLDTKDSVCERIYELLRLDDLTMKKQAGAPISIAIPPQNAEKDQIFGFFQSIYYLLPEKSARVSCCLANFLHLPFATTLCTNPKNFPDNIKWITYSILFAKLDNASFC